MRIVAGDWRGRRLTSPPGRETRPTTDRVRESLFNILAHAPWAQQVAGLLTSGDALVLDAFAGSGALGFEALSRGAERAWFWDRSAACITTIRDNARHLNAGDRVIAQRIDATKPPTAPRPVDLVFLDPPYDAGLLEKTFHKLTSSQLFAPDSCILCEHHTQTAHPMAPNGWSLQQTRSYGDVTVSFYLPNENEEAP